MEADEAVREQELAAMIQEGLREVELLERARSLAMSLRQETSQSIRWQLVTEAALEGLLQDLRGVARAAPRRIRPLETC